MVSTVNWPSTTFLQFWNLLTVLSSDPLEFRDQLFSYFLNRNGSLEQEWNHLVGISLLSSLLGIQYLEYLKPALKKTKQGSKYKELLPFSLDQMKVSEHLAVIEFSFAWFHELAKLRSKVICQSKGLVRQLGHKVW